MAKGLIKNFVYRLDGKELDLKNMSPEERRKLADTYNYHGFKACGYVPVVKDEKQTQ